MKINKRTTLCWCVFIIYMSINIEKNTAILIMIAYLIIGIIFYLIFGVIFSSNYVMSLKKKRKIKRALHVDFIKNRSKIDFLTNWLKKEGFKIKVNSYGNAYLENKIAKIQYFPSLKEKISVTPRDSTKRYLLYDEDQELKMQIERYLNYIIHVCNNHQYSNSDYRVKGISEPFKYDRSFTSTFSKIFFRAYGYIFLTISMCNFSSDYVPPFAKICIMVLYFIIEAS
jgi:hypothetical protein